MTLIITQIRDFFDDGHWERVYLLEAIMSATPSYRLKNVSIKATGHIVTKFHVESPELREWKYVQTIQVT